MAVFKHIIHSLLAVTGSVVVVWAIVADMHAPPMTAEQRSAIRTGMSPDQLAVVMGSQPTEIRTINGSEYRIWHWPGNALQALFVDGVLTSASTHSILASDIPPPAEE